MEGKLGAEKAGRLRQHIAECEECYELFVISAEALEEMEASETELVGANVRQFQPAWFAVVNQAVAAGTRGRGTSAGMIATMVGISNARAAPTSAVTM